MQALSAPQAMHENIESMVADAIGAAERHPHVRSAILGQAAMDFARLAHSPAHARKAPLLSRLAETFAQHALDDDAPPVLDDFHELLTEQAEARQQGMGDDGGDMDIVARSGAIHDARLATQDSARVSIAPASWGKKATLGRSGQFKYNPTQAEVAAGIAQSATLAYWQGKPHETAAYSIDLALSFAPPALSSFPFVPGTPIDISSRAYGIVAYGADGSITEVEFDAGFGTRFTVVGSYVSIVAGMDPPPTGDVAGALTFAASLGAFAAPSQAPVFRTRYIDNLHNGQPSVPQQRPKHAAQLLPVLSNAISGSVLLNFYAQGGQKILMSLNYPIGQLLLPIPLPSDVQYVTVTNNTGGTANFRLVFQLSM